MKYTILFILCVFWPFNYIYWADLVQNWAVHTVKKEITSNTNWQQNLQIFKKRLNARIYLLDKINIAMQTITNISQKRNFRSYYILELKNDFLAISNRYKKMQNNIINWNINTQDIKKKWKQNNTDLKKSLMKLRKEILKLKKYLLKK